MTIELITGTPGAGKTCFAVAKRIVPEFGRQVSVEREGGGVDLVERRIIVAGIRELAVIHDKLPHTLTGDRVGAKDIEYWNECDDDGEPVFKRLPGDPAHIVPATLFNWWLWCRPGDLIVCDEVQFIIPRGSLGKTPPHYIKSLEIHRHYGVDFMFITQSPQLLDSTLRNLVGLHRHVRSVLGSPFCMLYEWDHASNTERITGASKTWYWRRSAFFKLYKSTVAVVSPPKSGRFAFIAAPLLMAASIFGINAFIGKFKPAQAAQSPQAAAAAAAATVQQAQEAARPKNAFLVRHSEYSHLPKLTGCYSVRDICSCIDTDGQAVQVDKWACEMSSKGFDGLVKWEKRLPPPAAAASAGAAARPASPASAVAAPLPSLAS